jgi:hypothetical protein
MFKIGYKRNEQAGGFFRQPVFITTNLVKRLTMEHPRVQWSD